MKIRLMAIRVAAYIVVFVAVYAIITRLMNANGERALAGMLAGAVGGRIGGWIGAFLEAYFLHLLGRILGAAGRIAGARHFASIGSRIGLVVGTIVGGVAGGFSSLPMGLVTATALVALAIAAHAMSRLRSDPWLRGATIVAAIFGVAVGFLGAMLVGFDR